jgi:hypothetical protein
MITSDLPDGQPVNPVNPTNQHLHVPTREKTLEKMIQTTLGVLNCLQPYLLDDAMPTGDGTHSDVQGEARAAASVAFIATCDRIEALMKNDLHWSGTDGDAIVESIKNTQKTVRDYFSEQAVTVKELRRPSRAFNPEFVKIGDVFIAFYKSNDFPGGILIGRGATPAEALTDFDAAFSRKPEEQLRFDDATLARLGIQLPAPAPAPKTPARPRRKK